MPTITVPPRASKDLLAKDWVLNFNTYRQTNSLAESVDLIWNEWDMADNPYFSLLPNVESFIFSLLVFVPSRDDLSVISQVPAAIAWDDAPIYDTMTNAYYSVTSWNCADWKAWHQALEVNFGDTYEANAIWESAWENDDNYCSFLGVMICPDTDWCRYDCSFVEYLASKDIDIGNLLSNTTCDLSAIVLNIVKTVKNVSEGVKTISSFIPWAGAAAIIWGGYKFTQNN